MILVAGENLVDLLVDEDGEVAARLGGGPFNVARALARLETPCAFLSAVSSDRFGRMIRAALVEDGVDERCLVDSARPTMLALAQLDDGAATYSFCAAGIAAPSLTEAEMAAVVPATAPEILHVGTLGLVLEPMAVAIEQLVLGAADETLVMVDPNCRPDAAPDEARYRARLERVLERADVVKVSTDDLAYLEPDAPVAAAARALVRGRTRCVLVTDGERPVRVLTAAGETEVPATPVQVVDTVGAGDAFCAGFLSCWVREGRGIAELANTSAAAESASFAALVAGATVRRSGADPPRLAEMREVEALAEL